MIGFFSISVFLDGKEQEKGERGDPQGDGHPKEIRCAYGTSEEFLISLSEDGRTILRLMGSTRISGNSRRKGFVVESRLNDLVVHKPTGEIEKKGTLIKQCPSREHRLTMGSNAHEKAWFTTSHQTPCPRAKKL